MEFNKAQMDAVTHRDGPALVLAGPGSGKTTVLAERVKFLIGEGVRPSSILVVTFTRAAAEEMENRFLRSCRIRKQSVTFSTCHALFFRILRRECGYTERDILSEQERLRILKVQLKKIGMEASEDMLRYAAADISRMKNTMMPDPMLPAEAEYPAWCSPETFRRLYEGYNEALRRSHKIEFDDMPLFCLELFRRAPEILEKWQSVWQYLLVDEFQDINPVQYRLLCLLAAPEDHFFAVGDEDQSIYGFRGSVPQLILNFETDHPGTRKILLDVNYRCPEEIIAPACRLINENTRRTPKKIRGTGRRGGCVRLFRAENQIEEANLIASDLRARLQNGTASEQTAVLYRGRNAVQYLLHALSDQMIPYRMQNKAQDLYSHWIARDIFAYFSLAFDRESTADLLRILNRPQRFLPREIFTRAGSGWENWKRELGDQERQELEKLSRDLDRITRFTPYAALHYILEGIGYKEVLRMHAAGMRIPEEEVMEIPELLSAEAAEFDSFEAWQEAVDLRRQRQEYEETDRSGVLLSTIHGVKGLEFDIVYLMDMNETLLPIKAAVSEEQIEEERRLCYVAMTRSRKELNLYTLYRYHAHVLRPSRFLSEAALQETEPARQETGIDEKRGNR